MSINTPIKFHNAANNMPTKAIIVRVPDNPSRYTSGNNIYTTTVTLFGKIPVIRYVCCNCGYVENWVENRHELAEIKKTFG